MNAGPMSEAIFHVHPLRRCNLACGHCYSDSSPRATDLLALDTVAAAIRQAAAWGYQRLAISGGEPLLYPWLDEVVTLANECGMRTALITNGLLAGQKENLAILRRIDTLAISIDGMGVAHDRLRQRTGAFAGVLRTLALLADAGIDFHIICGVSSANLDDVEALAALACDRGAAALQLHPVSAAGRARTGMSNAVLGPDGVNLLYLASSLLAAAYHGRMNVHADLVHRRCVIAQPGMIYAAPEPDAGQVARPADLLGVLVLEPDGAVKPVSFGFAPLYGLGNVLKHPLGSMWQPWLATGYRRLSRLGRQLLAELVAGSGAAVFNPCDLLRLASHDAAAGGAETRHIMSWVQDNLP